MKLTPSRVATCLLAASLTPCAFATNGTMPHGNSIKSMGMGGVSIALPQDALAAADNPAGMAFVGERLDIGLAVVLPRPEATIGGTNFDGSGIDAKEWQSSTRHLPKRSRAVPTRLVSAPW